MTNILKISRVANLSSLLSSFPSPRVKFHNRIHGRAKFFRRSNTKHAYSFSRILISIFSATFTTSEVNWYAASRGLEVRLLTIFGLELNAILDHFYSTHAKTYTAEQWLGDNAFADAVADDAETRWMAK